MVDMARACAKGRSLVSYNTVVWTRLPATDLRVEPHDGTSQRLGEHGGVLCLQNVEGIKVETTGSCEL